MTARNILIRGLLAGFIAGLAAFCVGNLVGETQVDAAIAVEESHAASEAAPADTHDETTTGHTHEEDGTVVSRTTQKTWGLATGTIASGTALGGLVALVAASLIGRMGTFSPRASTLLVSLLGFIAVSFVPFLKYPATPPAVGNEDTIGSRTGLFFGFMLISILAAIAAVALAQHLVKTRGGFQAVVIATAAYLLVVVVVGQVMPTVNEIGDFPADTLWYFRRASLLTLGTMWAVLGVVLAALVGRLHEQQTGTPAPRDLATAL
jgi:predicted cobalt transporter CbtA